jgi:hypothetical protein
MVISIINYFSYSVISTIETNTCPIIAMIVDYDKIVSKLLQRLVSSTFLVEGQPNQISLLYGSQVMTPHVVGVSLVKEEVSRKLIKFDQGHSN